RAFRLSSAIASAALLHKRLSSHAPGSRGPRKGPGARHRGSAGHHGRRREMSLTVLGISAFYHDSAAALVQDGEAKAASQEERFSRVRHDPRFPGKAIDYCLEEAFIEPSNIDAIVFYDSPLLTLDRVLRNCLHWGSAGGDQFELAAPSILGTKLFVED